MKFDPGFHQILQVYMYENVTSGPSQYTPSMIFHEYIAVKKTAPPFSQLYTYHKTYLCNHYSQKNAAVFPVILLKIKEYSISV